MNRFDRLIFEIGKDFSKYESICKQKLSIKKGIISAYFISHDVHH